MKLSELKSKVRTLKKYGYRKDIGMPYYFKVFKLNQWNMHQCISIHDIRFSQYELEDFLQYLHEKNMKLLFARLMQEPFFKKQA